MSNKQQLQTNNIKYASLIELLRGKAAGGGEALEGITITITELVEPATMIYYIDNFNVLRSEPVEVDMEICALKNSILCVTNWGSSELSSCTFLDGPPSCRIFYVTG
jgi:hypothetical protein